MHVDVAIVGGGPGGATVGALLKKYDPSLHVLILERERFPRDHVGESQLPAISRILDEMGCWQQVEDAGFPIKVGATYSWGSSKELWDFDFYPVAHLDSLPRPGTFDGQRRHLAFQVDRAIYDTILLDHAAACGCDVRQETRVGAIHVEGDRVTEFTAEGLGVVSPDLVIDASGHAGIIRRAIGVGIDCPTALQNVAVWDYWQNAAWAEEIGVGGTRVQVMSVGYGWIWFIPLGPTRTSVGLVVPKEYLASSGRTLPQLYERALAEHARIAALMVDATSEGRLQTTKDWSFVARRQCGETWFLVGESSGFADPILAAGLTMTQAAGREAAYTILEERQGGDPKWLRQVYEERQIRRIRNHIRFADYWYSANTQFSELQEFTAEVAKANGLDLSPAKAWAWLAQGGFIDEELGAGVAGFDLPLLSQLGSFLGDAQEGLTVEQTNVFVPDLDGAVECVRARYSEGRVTPLRCWTRDGKVWPMEGRFEVWFDVLGQVQGLREAAEIINRRLKGRVLEADLPTELYQMMVTLEALVVDGWVRATVDPNRPVVGTMRNERTVHAHA